MFLTSFIALGCFGLYVARDNASAPLRYVALSTIALGAYTAVFG